MCDFISRCLTLYEVLAIGQWGAVRGGGGNHTFIMSPNVFTALVWSCRVVPWSLWCIHSHCDAIYKFLGKNSTLLMSCKNVTASLCVGLPGSLEVEGSTGWTEYHSPHINISMFLVSLQVLLHQTPTSPNRGAHQQTTR